MSSSFSQPRSPPPGRAVDFDLRHRPVVIAVDFAEAESCQRVSNEGGGAAGGDELHRRLEKLQPLDDLNVEYTLRQFESFDTGDKLVKEVLAAGADILVMGLEVGTKSMREKRGLAGGEDDLPELKRPALASVIVEALKVDSLQKLCSSLEPILRRVVSEELERALAKIGPARIAGRSSPKRIEGPDGRNLQLHFQSRLSLPLFTGGKVEGEQGALIHVVLVDANTGHAVTSGPEALTKLDIVVLEGDFNNEDDEDWTEEEFESHVVKEREGKRPLLTGDLQVTLKEGVGTLGDLTFTDNSSWIRSRKFRLGLKVASGYYEVVRIREAKTEAFTVKDHRGELYKKHYPPALNDEVWRLEKIGKDGSFHKRLRRNGIFSVEDFLRLVVRDSQKLRSILGSGMSNKMWEVLLEHSKTCVLSGKLYVYYPEETRNVGVAFNNIYELNGLITGEQYFSADSLSDSQKVYVDTLVNKAYENWNQVVEYDATTLLSSKQQKSNASRNDFQDHLDLSNSLDHGLLSSMPVSVQPHQPVVDSGLSIAGYNDNTSTTYSTQPQFMNSASRPQFDNSFTPNEFIGNSNHHVHATRNDNSGFGLPLGPPQASSSGFQESNNMNPFEWSNRRDNGSEDEIRLRSHQMRENEEIQHLLRMFSMGGHSSVNAHDESFSFPPFMPSPMPNFDNRNRSGKAVVGWLKIKAAMRWGFFIRKKAAEKRARIVELDEE